MKLLPSDVIIISGAARGADSIAEQVANDLMFKTCIFPAQWDKLGRAAGPIRNQQMLDENPDLIIAFHSAIIKSKGTADMVRRGRKKGVPVEIIT